MPDEYWKEWSEKEGAKAQMEADEMVNAQMDTEGSIFYVG